MGNLKRKMEKNSTNDAIASKTGKPLWLTHSRVRQPGRSQQQGVFSGLIAPVNCEVNNLESRETGNLLDTEQETASGSFCRLRCF